MNALELKGGLLNMIAQVEEESFLREIYALFQERLSATDWYDELPSEAQAELDLSIQESEIADKLVSHDEAVKTINAWL
ncbi:MAG: hypothetical protein AAF847_10340 [Bacteroidota bacterium]